MNAAATGPVRVLFVDDEEMVRMANAQVLRLSGFEVSAVASAGAALAALEGFAPTVVVSDVCMPGTDGLALLAEIRARDAELPVVLITGHGDIAMAVQAMRDGAYDFMEKPFFTERLVETVRRAAERRRLVDENRRLRAEIEEGRSGGQRLLGQSPAMRELRRVVDQVADTPADVLIHGETGTGKELVARALHERSARRGRPFVALNCAALPESVFENELFGSEAGAFTGASKRRIGKIEHANGGTLFLDELEGLPLALQAKLLRVLQERAIERLGANDSIAVDVRVVAATKDDLLALARAERFRSDLVYRLNVVELRLPPLRERREDIPLLFEHLVLQAAVKYLRPAPSVDAAVLQALLRHDWPGNVRELRNVAERVVLGLPAFEAVGDAAAAAGPLLAMQVDAFERGLIEAELKRCGGVVSQAAQALGLPRKTLHDKLKRLGIVAGA
jgi:two-component system C4-dicarboxylate transport response regulator DctD